MKFTEQPKQEMNDFLRECLDFVGLTQRLLAVSDKELTHPDFIAQVWTVSESYLTQEPESQLQTIFHEIGHCLLHQQQRIIYELIENNLARGEYEIFTKAYYLEEDRICDRLGYTFAKQFKKLPPQLIKETNNGTDQKADSPTNTSAFD